VDRSIHTVLYYRVQTFSFYPSSRMLPVFLAHWSAVLDSDRLPRKLVAILYADVAGYSRLTGEDEDGTHRRLSRYLDLISESVGAGNGRVIHYAGDAVLAQFPTPSEALVCAIRAQNSLRGENADLPSDRQVQFRIGVNLGEVIVDRDDIYGDGVNVAARLEGLAEPGGVCVSESVHTAVGNKLPIDYEFLGEQDVKNIEKPVRAYHARLNDAAELPTFASHVEGKAPGRIPLVAGGVFLVTLFAGVLVWYQTQMQEGVSSTMAQPEPASLSIAVLPFTNMSGDQNQAYLADGITEDVITNLSYFEGFLVISRTSSFAYKDKSMKSQAIGRELGVRYLLEGSIQRQEDQLRVTAQLIEAETGKHVWAGRYDRQVDDVFAIQDEITGSIASTLGETLWQAQAQKVARKPPSSFEAYDYRLRALDHLHRLNKDDNIKARELYEKALSLDSEYASAYIGLGWTYLLDVLGKWVDAGPEELDKALAHAQKAATITPDSAEAYRLIGRVYQMQRRHDDALAMMQRALELNPNNGDILANYGIVLIYAGRAEEGIEWGAKAIRRNPHHPDWYASVMATGFFLTSKHEDALRYLGRIKSPKMWDLRLLTAIYVELGELQKAEEQVAAILAINPNTSLASIEPALAYKDRAIVDRYLDALRKAGIPE
jgi:adenylate cyclase